MFAELPLQLFYMELHNYKFVTKICQFFHNYGLHCHGVHRSFVIDRSC